MAELSTIAAVEQDFRAYSGDNWQFDATFYTDSDKTIPADLTLYTEIELQIRASRAETGTPLVTADLTSGLQVVSGNILRVNVPGSKMEAVDKKTFQYDIEGRSATETKTLIQGQLQMQSDVVRT